ncbi:hypothetical protein FBU30_006997 [Linnemannia zychae]|nr:hypothetical protein FBU30_006997 [Linnemannia zychae]
MWDPTYNDTSTQQHSSDLTARPPASHDSHTFHAFDVNQTEKAAALAPVEKQDEQLTNYNNNTIPQRNKYPFHSSQILATEHMEGVMSNTIDSIKASSLLSSKEETAILETVSILPQDMLLTNTTAPNSHRQELYDSNSSNNSNNDNNISNNTCNIPIQIDFTSSVPHSIKPSNNNLIDTNTQQSTSTSTASIASPLPSPNVLLSQPQELMPVKENVVGKQPTLLAPETSLSLSKSSRDDLSCIVRLTIPASHMSLFHDALKNPPDPDLKIKKKTVRFNKTSLTRNSPPRSDHKHMRRGMESSGSTLTSPKANTKPTLPQILEKDPEEQEKQSILDEVRAERKALHTELNRYIAMVKQIQSDLELDVNVL